MEEKTLKNILISPFVTVATILFLYVIFYALPSFGSTGHELKTIYQNPAYIKENNLNCLEENHLYYWQPTKQELPEYVKGVYFRGKVKSVEKDYYIASLGKRKSLEISLELKNDDGFTKWYPVGLFFTDESPEQLIKAKLSNAQGSLGNVVLLKKVNAISNCGFEFLVKVPPNSSDSFTIELKTKRGFSPELAGLVFKVQEPLSSSDAPGINNEAVINESEIEEEIQQENTNETIPVSSDPPPVIEPIIVEDEPEVEYIEEKIEEINEKAEEKIEKIQEKLEEATEKTEEKIEKIQEKLEEIAEKAEEKIEKAIEKFEEKDEVRESKGDRPVAPTNIEENISEEKHNGPKDKEDKDTEKKSHEEKESKKDEVQTSGHAPDKKN